MLSDEQKFEFLKKTPLFRYMRNEELRAICEITIESDHPSGHTLFREGEPGNSLCLLLSGEVAIYKEDVPVLNLKGPGTCFGEMALLEEGVCRSATLVCLSRTAVLCIRRNDFLILMSREFSLVEGMFRVLNEKIRENLDVRLGTIRREIARRESMRLAREIQQSLLPQEEISDRWLKSSGSCKSADVVGGDYYDYLPLSYDRYAVILADVMGHGYHSALLMAMAKSGLHTQVVFDPSITGVMGALSRVAGRQNKTWVYLTCCYVIVDAPNAKLMYVNAGHPPMLLYSARGKEIVRLDSQSPPLGLGQLESKIIFEPSEVSWRQGDVLLLYSDGITEAANRSGSVFGISRLQGLLYKSFNKDPLEIRDGILLDLEEHLDGEEVEDDCTLVVLKFTSKWSDKKDQQAKTCL